MAVAIVSAAEAARSPEQARVVRSSGRDGSIAHPPPAGVASEVLALQRSVGNEAVAALLVQRCGDNAPCDCGCSDVEQAAAAAGTGEVLRQAVDDLDQGAAPARTGTEPEGLVSPRLAGNPRLERAIRNSPAVHIGESGDGVRLVQESLVDQGFPMPGSTKPTGELDGGFGRETLDAVEEFQGRQGLEVDGIVGHDTLGELDRLEAGGAAPPLLKPKPGQGPSVIELPGGLQILVGDGPGELPGLGSMPNVFGSPGSKKPASRITASADDQADEAACAALPASQMGAAVNDILSWQSGADDARMLVRLADIVCFPDEYRRLVTGLAVGLSAPQGTDRRRAMLGQMAQSLDDFTAVLEIAKTPAVAAFGLPQLAESRVKRIADRIAALRAIAGAESSAQISGQRLATVSLAAGEVGKVDHKLLDGGRRYGADRLLEYFRVAFGGTVPPAQQNTIDHPPQNVKQLFSCAVSAQPCDPLAPWCGIFASWALQSAGISLPPWNLNDGKGLNQRGAWRLLQTTNGDEIRPGDLATRSTGNHQALVIAIRPDGIETAEGNTNEGGGSGLEAAIGGKIVHKTYQGSGLSFKDWNTGFWRPPGAD